jgi:hypothetical protein
MFELHSLSTIPDDCTTEITIRPKKPVTVKEEEVCPHFFNLFASMFVYIYSVIHRLPNKIVFVNDVQKSLSSVKIFSEMTNLLQF